MDPLVSFLKQGYLSKDKGRQKRYIGKPYDIGCLGSKSCINARI